jgi:hypothetical protein
MAVCWQKLGRLGFTAVIIGVITGGAILPAAVHAQDDINAVRGVVQKWLLQELGKPGLILVRYTYESMSWPDSSLGCPQPGQTATPGIVQGYRWTFLFSNQVRYEVHTGLTGTPAVLCSSTSVTPDVRLTTYRNTLFTILVPEAWLVFSGSDGQEVLFAPEAEAKCDQPGMRVTTIGRVASGVTPDQLLDEYLAGAGVTDDPAARGTVGTFGRSTAFQTSCDTGTRGWRVSAFVEYGTGYQVEQWSPLDQFDQWDALFENMLSQFGPVESSVAAPSGEAASAPADSGTGTGAESASAELTLNALPVAHLFVGDVFMGTLNDLPGRSVTTVPTFERRYLGFSPDGLYLSYIDVTNGELRVMNTVDGVSPRKIAQGVDPRFPPAWSADSTQIAYVVATGENDASGAETLDINAVPPEGGSAAPQGSFTFIGGCPAASSDPADGPYFEEAGPLGQDNVLVWLPDGEFLISTRCDIGLEILDPADGRITDLGADLRGGVVGPDLTHFLARTDTGLSILDFTAWRRTNLPVGATARQLAWGPDGQTAYYSTETLAHSEKLDDPSLLPRVGQFFKAWPMSVAVYDVSLVRVDLTTSQETVIWQGQGRGIGRIAAAPDNSGVLFSLIPSSLPLAEVFQSGGDALAVEQAWPDPALYWLPTGSAGAYLMAYSGQPAFAPITVPGQ